MKLRLILSVVFCSFLFTANAQKGKVYTVTSPDGNISLNVTAGKAITWQANYRQTPVITPSAINLNLSNEVLGKNAVVVSAKNSSVNQSITTPFYKKDRVEDRYNQLSLTFKGNFGLIFRAYNDGVAYRFVTNKPGEITVLNEDANFNFKDDYKAYLPFVNDYRNKDKFNTSFEALYDYRSLSTVQKDSLAFLPVLIDLAHPLKVAILEADLLNYPGMYLTKNAKEDNGLHAAFAPYPSQETNGGYKNINYVVTDREKYIAKTSGTRTFPWRVVVISTADKQLANNDMVQKLSTPSKITNPTWIKPGKVAWDWWNDWNITHVDFKAGINVPTYKYYIDFAAANKLEYIIMDEGWSDDSDLNQFKLDVQQIVDYGKQKHVGVILWSSWYAITRNTDALFSKFANMGVKGFKIDFIDRDDQKMVNSLYTIAEKAAKYHLLVDYHGMYKPSGLQRTWPNVINFEGVKGLENLKWGVKNHPGYDVTIPFIRMLAGPMDYTPGAMRNATKDSYQPSNSNPMSQGTRCHQLAMYTVFEAPLQMLADNPTSYKQEQECTDYIAAVPTTFNETVALDGSVGEYVSMARRKGTTWYAGAMTNWTPRDLSIDLSFLGKGRYRAIIFSDGVNADRNATDYTRKTINVSANDRLPVHLAPGGGWAARFEKVD